MAYTKLDSTLTDSTIWQAPDATRIVWITMLSMADQNGYIGASVPGLAGRARVSLQACIDAISSFEGPDEWSRTKDHEGRRIAPAEGGWVLLNHAKYREAQNAEDRRERSRIAMAALRAKRKAEPETVVPGEHKLTCKRNVLTKLAQAAPEAAPTPAHSGNTEVWGGPGGNPETPDPSASATVAAGKPAAQPKTSRGSRLPEAWQLPKAWGEWTLAEFPAWTPDKVRLEAAKFADHWHAKPGKDGTKVDWLATWRNWCRSSIAHRDDSGAPQPRPGERTGRMPEFAAEAPMTPAERAASDAKRREVMAKIKGALL